MYFTSFNNSFYTLNPLSKIYTQFTFPTIPISSIYPLMIFLLFYFSVYELNFKFKSCEWIENMMSYVKKYIKIFPWLFSYFENI
jgi:hypothetical protein